jgi:DNA-binding beta-propeller fold protein YncE
VSSPSARYLACPGYGGIEIRDTLISPIDGEVWEDHPFDTPRLGRPYESDDGAGVSEVAWSRDGTTVYAVSSLRSKRFLTTVDKTAGAVRGWSTTDRELVGLDAPVRDVAVEPDGGLLLFGDEKVFRVEAKSVKARWGEVVAVAAPAELLRPRTVEVDSDGKKIRLDVLDIRCGSSGTP